MTRWFTIRGRVRSAKATEALAEVNRKLSGLAESTERDFLTVGGKLEEILERARTDSETLASLIAESGPQSDDLAAALDGITGWANQADQDSGCANLLAELSEQVRAVSKPLMDLKNTSRMLQVTGTLTRVESARLGERAAAFDALAEEISGLAAGIDGKANVIAEAALAMRALTDQARTSAQALEHGTRTELTRVLNECAAANRRLADEQQCVLGVAGRTHEGFGNVVAEVGELVIALQCQDSTRQRIEHVQEALTGMQPPAVLSQALELQAAQLADANASFQDAIDAIRHGLMRLSEAVGAFAAKAREQLIRTNGSDADESYGAIEQAIAHWSSLRQGIGEAAQRVRQSCADLASFVCEIESVGVRMLRLALNAEIQASHLAESGMAMQAVVGEICRVSRDASACAEGVAVTLRQVRTLAETLAEVGEQSDAHSVQESVTRLATLSSQLQASNRQKGESLSHVARDAESLSSDIAALSRSITAGESLNTVCGECVGLLTALAGDCGPSPAARAAIEDAGARYTMHAERRVHEALHQAPPAPPAAGEGNALGDNVELF